MHINDYLIAGAIRQVRAQPETEPRTHRHIINILIAYEHYDAANQYLQPFTEDQLDNPLDITTASTI